MSSKVSQAPQINGGHREDSSQVRLIEDGQNNEQLPPLFTIPPQNALPKYYQDGLNFWLSKLKNQNVQAGRLSQLKIWLNTNQASFQMLKIQLIEDRTNLARFQLSFYLQSITLLFQKVNNSIIQIENKNRIIVFFVLLFHLVLCILRVLGNSSIALPIIGWLFHFRDKSQNEQNLFQAAYLLLVLFIVWNGMKMLWQQKKILIKILVGMSIT